MSMPSGSIAVRAAPISEPMSMVPVVSTVTSTKIGSLVPVSRIARRQPLIAALVWSKSCEVSTKNASEPPLIKPMAWSLKVSLRKAYST